MRRVEVAVRWMPVSSEGSARGEGAVLWGVRRRPVGSYADRGSPELQLGGNPGAQGLWAALES